MTTTRRRPNFAPALLALAALAAACPDLVAQGPAWRTDYNSARREATEKGRPILLDIGTENCFWCRKLDATTFRDPAVLALVNSDFIPLRVDAEREPGLVQRLQIQSYPTLVLAGADGRIITVIEGYVEAPKLLGHLQTTAAACAATPVWMARDFQDASKAVSLGENSRAITLFKTILEDGKQRPVQQKAREHLRVLEQQAENRLAHARSMEDRGQYFEAIDTLSDLMRVYPGTPAANEAKGLLANLAARPEVRDNARARRATELLALAKEEFRTQQFFSCLERCELIAATFGDLPEAREASKLLHEIRGNPEWMARACNNLNERLCSMYLSLADSWLKKGKSDEAAVCLEKVQQLSPGSHHAQMAQVKLAQMQGKPGLQADFKKP
jgi:thioredoxin-like negative regulator of GroEL